MSNAEDVVAYLGDHAPFQSMAPDALAELASASTTRVFISEIGEGPGAYVDRVRAEAARRRLEETTDTVSAIECRSLRGSHFRIHAVT
ncbi:hypothetical protein A5784_09305 [Mycobacterium sp. 852013-50091_SCH5140682]|nr:hypothetical protein A5784_09305 [Mycobacterium sp. 852013-50091_SCH5140682]